MRTVTVLKDNIDLVIDISEAVRGRYDFVKSLAMLPSVREYKPAILSRLPVLQHKQDEVSSILIRVTVV